MVGELLLFPRGCFFIMSLLSFPVTPSLVPVLGLETEEASGSRKENLLRLFFGVGCTSYSVPLRMI